MTEHYPNAACRHLSDSKILLDRKRWDGSAYLAGYVIECSLKAVISHPARPPEIDLRDLGHDLSALTHKLDVMASARKSAWKRHVPAPLLKALRDGLDSKGWNPSMRYDGCNPLWEKHAADWWSLANRCFRGFTQNLVTEAAT